MPRPARLQPFEAWGEPTSAVEVDGEALHRAEVRAVFTNRGVHVTSGGVELTEIPVLLTPSDAVEGGIDVVCDRQIIGSLDVGDAPAYAPIVQDLSHRSMALLGRARIWGLDDGLLRSRVTVYLPDPHDIWPPMPLPTSRHVVLPPRTRFQVTEEEQHLSHLVQVLAGSASAKAVATLHAVVVSRPRSSVELVQVRIREQAVGVLSSATSAHLLGLVKALESVGITPVVYADITGNTLKVDVSIKATRASELPQAWLDQHLNT